MTVNCVSRRLIARSLSMLSVAILEGVSMRKREQQLPVHIRRDILRLTLGPLLDREINSALTAD